MSLKLNVGGEWDFCFDPEDTGVQSQWYKNKPPETKKITLPHVWDIEENESDATVAFYFKRLDIDEGESPKRFFIRFDSIHHYATIWLNGEKLGTHLGGHTPFDLNASKHVEIGKPNLLVIRVQTPDPTGRLDNRPSSELPLGAIYKTTPFAGIMGDIHLLMGGRAGIQYVTVYPDYEANQVTLETKFWNPKNYKADLEFTITDPNGKKGTMPKFIKLEKEDHTYSISFTLDDAIAWSPEEPNLYHVKVDLLGSYAWEIEFGLRRIEIERGSMKLNHVIRRVRGVNYLPIFPFYHALPPFDFSYETELKLIKDSGFNLIRSAGTPLPASILKICDKIGLLVIQETTCYNQKSSKDGLEELKEQIQTMINLTGHHACIVAWGIGAENGSMALENGNKLLRYTSDIDPYRPIISNFNSVILDNISGISKIDLGKVYNPTETKIEAFGSHKLKMSLPISSATQSLLTNYCSSRDAKKINDHIHGDKSFWERYNYLKDELSGKILINGVGAWSPNILSKLLNSSKLKPFRKHPETTALKNFSKELDSVIEDIKLWNDTDSFLEDVQTFYRSAVTCNIESLLINTQISGYFFEQWADFDNNFSGLVDWFRKPKSFLEHIKPLNQRTMIMSETEIRTPYMGTSATIDIFLLNEENLEDYGLLVRVKGPNGRIWHQESMPGVATPGINSIGRFKFPVGMEHGWFTFDLALSKAKKEIAKKEAVFFVPKKVNLDSLLPSIDFHGAFPDTITYAANNAAEIIIMNNIHTLGKDKITAAFEKAKNGANLILATLTPNDAKKLNSLNMLPFEISLFASRWEEMGCFHYAYDCPEFKELPNNGILDQIYADIIPKYSLTPKKELTTKAGCMMIREKKEGTDSVHTGIDIAEMQYGKGKIYFYQADIFSPLGKNALADQLFYNLIQLFLKKS
ncbi:MAG: hypothetical protein HQK83_05075 [Fibrobacteria bacterium]|nr:hypothetical protein [Fibrobacteria bacterium]